MIIVNIYVSFINYNRVIWEAMVSSVHNTLYRLLRNGDLMSGGLKSAYGSLSPECLQVPY